MTTTNNYLVCEPYVGKRGIQSKISRGVSTIQQKNKLVGLKVLCDARIDKELYITKGSVVYFREDVLCTDPSYTTPMECDSIKESFVLANFGHIVMIKE